jgi:hypothetical protein
MHWEWPSLWHLARTSGGALRANVTPSWDDTFWGKNYTSRPRYSQGSQRIQSMILLKIQGSKIANLSGCKGLPPCEMQPNKGYGRERKQYSGLQKPAGYFHGIVCLAI